LVKNAFKHGASGDINQAKIDIEVVKRIQLFIVKSGTPKDSIREKLMMLIKKGSA
jgi:hypothetical protein